LELSIGTRRHGGFVTAKVGCYRNAGPVIPMLARDVLIPGDQGSQADKEVKLWTPRKRRKNPSPRIPKTMSACITWSILVAAI
jgi:hypothetical protein